MLFSCANGENENEIKVVVSKNVKKTTTTNEARKP